MVFQTTLKNTKRVLAPKTSTITLELAAATSPPNQDHQVQIVSTFTMQFFIFIYIVLLFLTNFFLVNYQNQQKGCFHQKCE